jgi:prolyl-tRNA synthetase
MANRGCSSDADRVSVKKESRAKALLECAHKVPVISTIVFVWSGCDFSRRRFSSHRLGPQPPERKIIALMHSIQRISYSYLIAVQFVTMVVVHCTINHRDLVRPAVSAISKGEKPSNRLPCLYFAERSGFTARDARFPESCAEPMRLSRFFLPILRETPKEAEIVSHRLMLRAGMVRQEAAGIYAFLPLGLRVLQKVCRIVREEQDRSGAIEMLMPTIQSADLWRESGRYEDYGKEMLRIKDRHERDMLYGPTNEEMITEIFRAYVRSYKDLPLNLYHLQWKFRDEVRPRFGTMRSREFLMKDAYSFDLDFAGARHAYNRMFVAYLRTFARMGLRAIPMVADTGPIGGNLSHEFIILASTGESEVYCHRDYLDFAIPEADVNFDDVEAIQRIVDTWTSRYAATSEKHEAAVFDALPADAKMSARGIEVGHIFYFGTKYSAPMKAVVAGPDGGEHPVHMGSYGIGPTRLVAAIVEAFHDDAGIKWPEAVAPFKVAILNLKQGDQATDAASESLYRQLSARGVDVLYNDLEERPGSKFASTDLIGIPWQILVGPKGLAEGKIELKCRADGSRQLLAPADAIERLAR